MSDYIKREDILGRTVKRNSIWNGITNACGQGLEEIVNDIPSADVEPIRHGRWNPYKWYIDEDSWTDELECSECGYKFGDTEYNYCPNCGAKMDEEKDE